MNACTPVCVCLWRVWQGIYFLANLSLLPPVRVKLMPATDVVVSALLRYDGPTLLPVERDTTAAGMRYLLNVSACIENQVQLATMAELVFAIVQRRGDDLPLVKVRQKDGAGDAVSSYLWLQS